MLGARSISQEALAGAAVAPSAKSARKVAARTRRTPVGALLGRTRAAILWRLDLPHTTTQLAGALGQSPSAISQHLAVLRRTALVTS